MKFNYYNFYSLPYIYVFILVASELALAEAHERDDIVVEDAVFDAPLEVIALVRPRKVLEGGAESELK